MRQLSVGIGQMVCGFIFILALYYVLDNYLHREVDRRVEQHFTDMERDMARADQILNGA